MGGRALPAAADACRGAVAQHRARVLAPRRLRAALRGAPACQALGRVHDRRVGGGHRVGERAAERHAESAVDDGGRAAARRRPQHLIPRRHVNPWQRVIPAGRRHSAPPRARGTVTAIVPAPLTGPAGAVRGQRNSRWGGADRSRCLATCSGRLCPGLSWGISPAKDCRMR